MEHFGVAIIQQTLAFEKDVSTLLVDGIVVTHNDMLWWLTEQYDRAERKETWSITMEASITVFVLAELVFSFLNYFSRKC